MLFGIVSGKCSAALPLLNRGGRWVGSYEAADSAKSLRQNRPALVQGINPLSRLRLRNGIPVRCIA